MKKATTILLMLIFVMVTVSQAFATTQPEIIFQQKEIKDINKLWQKANKGISDLPSDAERFSAVLKDAPSNYVVDKKATTQILKKEKKNDGTIITSYVTTTFAIVKDNDKKEGKSTLSDSRNDVKLASTKLPDGILELLAASKSWDEYDDSYSIRHEGKFYYSSYTDASSILWVRPEKVEGRWYRDDSSVSITSSRYGAEWLGLNPNGEWCGDSDFNNPLPISWGNLYSNTISNDGYINCSAGGCYVVGEQRDQLQRGGSSWRFLSNYVFGDLDL